MTPSFTLGASWLDQYVSGLVLINALLGNAGSAPQRPATPESILETLQQIARGKYRPQPSSATAGGGGRGLELRAPDLNPSAEYLVLVLNAATETGNFVSVDTGGILFEDPAWALLAAHAVSLKPPLGVPIADSDADLRERLGKIQSAIRSGKYVPTDFFGATLGVVPPATEPEFRLMQITAGQLTAIRERGIQSFGKPLRFYELFERPKRR